MLAVSQYGADDNLLYPQIQCHGCCQRHHNWFRYGHHSGIGALGEAGVPAKSPLPRDEQSIAIDSSRILSLFAIARAAFHSPTEGNWP